MIKEEKLKEQINKYEEEKKLIDMKIRKTKSDLRWLKIKRLTQRKDRMGYNHNKGVGRLKWG